MVERNILHCVRGEDLLVICSRSNRINVDEGENVFEEGQSSSDLYIVLSGSIVIWRLDSARDGPNSPMGGMGVGSPKGLEEDSSAERPYERPGAVVISTLSVGDVFGELELLNEKLRVATATCKEPAELVSISAADYEQLVKGPREEELRDWCAFLSETAVFQSWSMKSIRSVSYFLKYIPIENGTVVVKPKERAKDVFFVYKGDFKAYEADENRKPSLVYRPGDVFGDSEVMFDQTHTRRISATTKGHHSLLALTASDFVRLILFSTEGKAGPVPGPIPETRRDSKARPSTWRISRRRIDR